MLRSVAVIVQAPVAVFELGVLAEVFGIDRTDDGVPAFDYRVCAEHPGNPLPAGAGMQVIAEHPLAAAGDADLVAVVCSSRTHPPAAPVLDAIRAASERGAHLLAVCTGVFALAHAGVLDGRRVATHWRYADQLAREHPAIAIDAGILYFRDGPVLSCAGTASGIDACLHLVRGEVGPAAANRIARRMVVPPVRQGTQRQLLAAAVVADDGRGVQPVLDWIEDHLDEPVTTRDLSDAIHVSERTLLRRFADQVGVTPHEWLTLRRVDRARELLAHSSSSIDAIARQCGFGDAHLLRHHFRRVTDTTPTEFRSRLTPAPTAGAGAQAATTARPRATS